MATLLRLHNNSSCSISVETTDTSHNEVLNKREESRRPNGDFITRFIPIPPKDFELEIFYDVKESEGKAWKPGNYWQHRDISFSYPIPSGHSAAFPVHEKFFQKKWSVSVPFNYKWEAGPNSLYTISHRVFYFRDLPKGFYVDDTQADYPAVLFAPISDPNKPDWEILPQEVKAGEVILSKRNELGILPNFAIPFDRPSR